MTAQATAELDSKIRPMMSWVSRNPNQREMLDVGNEFILKFPPQRALTVATALSLANPFFLPDVPDAAARDLAVSAETMAEIVMRAKLTASRARQANVLVACAPKSASTFIQAALIQALGLPQACLYTTALDWAAAGAQGAALREQELDELSLIQNGLNQRGYVAQHHARCSPYMARLLSTYAIKPIVTHRNIADTIVSMDDMVMAWRRGAPGIYPPFFYDAMPSNYQQLTRPDRLAVLAHRWAAWLLQFYISWKKCARAGIIEPLFIRYETDFLGDKAELANRIAAHIGPEYANADRLAAALEDKSDASAKRLNKGVAGRGAELPAHIRDFILDAARDYADDEDLSALIGEEHA